MRTQLTPDEHSSFDRDGFLVVLDFLTPDELREWSDAVAEEITRRKAHEGGHRLPGRPDTDEIPEVDVVFEQTMQMWSTSQRVRKIICDPAIGEMVAGLVGADGMRMGQDQALFKQPYAQSTFFHMDVPFLAFHSTQSVTLWVPFDEATIQNGCLYYIPGTHKEPKTETAKDPTDPALLFKMFPEWAERDPVPCPVPLGGCLLHNGLTVHAAGANMTRHARRAHSIHFMPDGATYSGIQSMIPDEKAAGMQVGDVLDDESVFPLVWRRSA